MKLKKLLFAGSAASILCAFFCGCNSSAEQPGIKLSKDALLIDVRSVEEFRSGHLPGAINIPHTEIAEKISAAAPEKSTPLYLYCRSGRRVGIAMKTLANAGYHTVCNLGGLEEAAKKLNLQPLREE